MKVAVNRDFTTGNAHGPKREWVTGIRYEVVGRFSGWKWTSK